jgi:hypothetical protein
MYWDTIYEPRARYEEMLKDAQVQRRIAGAADSDLAAPARRILAQVGDWLVHWGRSLQDLRPSQGHSLAPVRSRNSS